MHCIMGASVASSLGFGYLAWRLSSSHEMNSWPAMHTILYGYTISLSLHPCLFLIQCQLVASLHPKMRHKLLSLTPIWIRHSSSKPFEAIPGPPRLPVLGNLHLYKLPGLYSIPAYHDALRDMHGKYGPLVREDRGTHPILHVFDPEDVKTVFSLEGKSPVIPPLQEATQFYRTKRELSLGLGNTNGEVWYRLRSAVHKMMLRPQEVSYYLPLVDSVANAFTDKIEGTVGEDRVVDDLRTLVGKWILESSGMICFESRLGAFDRNERLVEKMIQANRLIFLIAGQLKFALPIYKLLPTPRMNKFFQAEDFFYANASKFIQETIDKIQALMEANSLDGTKYNFLSYLLSRKELSSKDVFIITFSLFGDGLSTTTPTFLFALYLLAKHPEVQERVYSEIEKYVGPQQPLTIETLNKLALVKSAVKETLRLLPNGTEVSRITQTDMVLSGYHVPAQTHIDLNQFVHFRSPKYFTQPDDFIPERWLRDGDSRVNLSFLFIPFGHGTRMCAGRRFAEQDLHTGLTRVLQRYRLELKDPNEEMEQVYETLLFPKHPLKIRFIPR